MNAQQTSIGAPPELAWIPVKDCVVDDTYQRSLESRRSQRAVEHIMMQFDWTMFGCVIVTRRKRAFVVIDGQHRIAAAKARAIDEVPAVIVKGDSAASITRSSTSACAC